jgi:hypothetical protein
VRTCQAGREQQRAAGQFFEQADGGVHGGGDYPWPVRGAGIAAQRAAVVALAAPSPDEPLTGLAVSVPAPPGQVEDYWREGVIPVVRYSPSAVTSPPAVTGELGFTTAAMTGCTQGDRVESQVAVRDDPDC